MQSRYIAILEDHEGRATAMRLVAARVLPEINFVAFDCASDMLGWLDRILPHTVLISLDHDLLPQGPRDARGRLRDPGTGRDVANYLAGFPCVCPVIVHTSNVHAAPGMLHMLREAGWVCSAVTPRDDVAWVAEEWQSEVVLYRERGLLFW
jgi:hypothetical protein